MARQRCPECGAELPEEAGQHALAPAAGVVECPSCGARARIGKVGAADDEDAAGAAGDVPRAARSAGGESRAPETFSGEETVEGVMDELERKPGGPGSGT